MDKKNIIPSPTTGILEICQSGKRKVVNMFRKEDGDIDGVSIIVSSIILVIFLCGLNMFISPIYSVWEQGLEGQAELAKADYSKKVAVQEAQAKKDSASLLADAEVLRAGGVAKANAIIGKAQAK